MSARKHHARHEATHGGESGHRGNRTYGRDAGRLLGVVAVVVLVATVVVPSILPDNDVVTRAAARQKGESPADAQVTIAAGAAAIPVPRSFLGISTEYWALPQYERHLAAFERILAQLHVAGNGPFVLRVGGDSADHTFWELRMRRPPPWVFGLTPAWLSRARALLRHTHLRLIVDLNLLTDSPFAAAEWAGAAYRALPRGSIAGFEIGNEPDIYSRVYWLAIVSHTGFGARVLPARLSAGRYATDFVSDAQAIRQVAPGVPLLGPALANPLRDAYWLRGLLVVARHQLGMATGHRYPYSACVKPRSPVYPTIARILSDHASVGMARAVSGVVSIAHRAGLPFRLTEMNSVTCGGRRGVSDSFATALWAPDALFELLRAGVDGVNVHLRADAINAAFTIDRAGLSARPLMYGLILFAKTLGPDAELLPLRVQAPHSPHLKVWAVQTRSALHVLLIDKGKRSVDVVLRIPTAGHATVRRLTAPSESSHTGVTLAGRQLGRDGRWRGPLDKQMIPPLKHGYEVTVSGMSAALVSVPAGR